MAEPLEIAAAALPLLGKDDRDKPLAGRRMIVTSGPTHEPIDPVRYIANRSSGKQGHAIAAAAAAAGADVTLVSGPVNLPDPLGVNTIKIETAQEMLPRFRRRCLRTLRCLPLRWPIGAWISPMRTRSRSGRRIAHARLGRKSRYPVGGRSRREQPAAPRHWFRGRDRAHHRTREGQVGAQRMRLDRCQRRFGDQRRDGRRPQYRPSGDRTGVKSWPPQSKEEVAHALVTRIADALAGAGQ